MLIASFIDDNFMMLQIMNDSINKSSWHDPLKLLLESTSEGIYGINTAGQCTFINRAGAALLGYEPQQVLGKNMHNLIHHAKPDGSHYAEHDCPIFQAFLQGKSCRIDQDVLWRANGTRFAVEYSSNPMLENGAILGAVVTFVDISERKYHEDILRQARLRLEKQVADRTQDLSEALINVRNLSAHLHSIREEERTRIAREIHDELGSLLIALKLDVGWLTNRLQEQPALMKKCQSMARLIDTAVENVGRIMTDLRPSILDHEGLWAALEWQVEEFVDASELTCDLQVRLGQTPAPDGLKATAIFRIFQEMLSNVARHAKAQHVQIVLHTQKHFLIIEVNDDGCGADISTFSHPQAYGIIGMRERAGHFGGEIMVHSAPNKGTQLRLIMPLANAEFVLN